MDFDTIKRLIDGERDYQAQRWPGHRHRPGSYLTYLDRYLKLAAEIDSTTNYHNQAHYLYARATMRKIASLAFACMEENGVVYRRKPVGFFRRLGEALRLVEAPQKHKLGAVSRAEVWAAVESELEQSGWVGLDPHDEFSEWLTVLRVCLALTDNAWVLTPDDTASLDCMRTVAAAAVRCLELHGAPRRETMTTVFAA